MLAQVSPNSFAKQLSAIAMAITLFAKKAKGGNAPGGSDPGGVAPGGSAHGGPAPAEPLPFMTTAPWNFLAGSRVLRPGQQFPDAASLGQSELRVALARDFHVHVEDRRKREFHLLVPEMRTVYQRLVDHAQGQDKLQAFYENAGATEVGGSAPDGLVEVNVLKYCVVAFWHKPRGSRHTGVPENFLDGLRSHWVE